MTLVAGGCQILPKNEAQCRSLRSCCETEDDLVSAWRSVTKNIEPHKITAKSIKAHLKPDEESEVSDTEKVELPCNLSETIRRYARLAKMSFVQLLKEIFQPVEICNNFDMDKKIERWENDLEKLVLDERMTTTTI